MSRLKERIEKNCLNCNAEVLGRYCQKCGQENIEPKESAWHLLIHFFNDLTHFDGKFFSTLKHLVFRPGKASFEYMQGKRASYLNPLRMYIFTSALFFLVFFSSTILKEDDFLIDYDGRNLDEIARMDSTEFDVFTRGLSGGKPLNRNEFAEYIDTVKGNGQFNIISGKYEDKHTYDSLLKTGAIKHNWLKRKMEYRQIELSEKYQNNGKKLLVSFFNALLHSFPQMLFISLPLLAFFLKLLYIRNKEFYYSNHIIFSVHLYIFVFILMLLLLGISALKKFSGWGSLNFMIFAGVLWMFVYQYKAMRVFYAQRGGKTILKQLLLNISMLAVIILLFIIFSLFSLLKI